jgi:enoyl-CoA hydratase/carnithine racemase
MTAKPITAQRAYETALWNHVVPKERLLEKTKLGGRSSRMRHCRCATLRSWLSGTGYERVGTGGLTRISTTSCARGFEEPRAFAEKRKPQWKGW